MKKMFLKFNEHLRGYWIFEGAQTSNFMLQDLQDILRFEKYEAFSFEYLHLSKLNNILLLWDSSSIKQKATDIFFNTVEEQEVFDKAYSLYSAKRWDDMPKLRLTNKNYHMLVDKWKDIKTLKPTYVIFSQDETTNFVDIESKNVLSQQDLDDMNKEHEKYLKYKKAYDLYLQLHPDRSDVWRSPADDEYESDWQQYVDKD